MKSVYRNRSICFLFVCLTQVLTATGTREIERACDTHGMTHQAYMYRNYGGSFADDCLIDTSIVYAPAENEQVSSEIAFNGSNYLVVWSDDRSARFHRDIYGTRVSPDGIVLDPAGITISITDSAEGGANVASNGLDFLVVWGDNRHGDMQIFGARISGSGEVLDSVGFPIIANGDYLGGQSVTFGDTNYFLVWHEYRGSDYDICGARVNPSGVLLDTVSIPISTAPGTQRGPKIIFDGVNFFVTWYDKRSDSLGDIYCARVSQSGEVLDPAGTAVSTDTAEQGAPRVAAGDSNYLVVWTHGRYDVCGARVGHSGEVLDTNFIVISAEVRNQMYPSVSFDGVNYFVTWQDNRNDSYDIYGTRVDQSGLVVDSTGLHLTTIVGSEYIPYIKFGNESYLLSWYKAYDIQGARIDQTGNVIDTLHFTISTAANNQSRPSLSYYADYYFVVWEDFRDVENFDVRGARVSNSGSVLDPSGIDISANSCIERCPSITPGNKGYFIVWQDKRTGSFDIYGARVDITGAVIDTLGIPISTAQNDQEFPTVAFDGTHYLVVWHDKRHGPYPWIYGARMDTCGTVIDTSDILISSTVGCNPAIAFDGDNYLVAWTDLWGGYSDIVGTRVDRTGTVLDTGGIAIGCAAYDQEYASIAFDGTNYFVVWRDERTGHFAFDIYGARVTKEGYVLDTMGIPISTDINYQESPVIAFDGTNHFVVWQDSRDDALYNLYGAKVSPSGAVIDSFIVCSRWGRQILPALAQGSGDQVLISYSGWTYSIDDRAANTMRIWGTFHPLVTVEEEKQDSGHQVRTPELTVFPNPARQQCNIRFSISKQAPINIVIYDVAGRVHEEIVSGILNAGVHNITLDVGDFAQGVYFVRMEAHNSLETEKLILIK